VDRVMERRDSLRWRKLCAVLLNYEPPNLRNLNLNLCVFHFPNINNRFKHLIENFLTRKHSIVKVCKILQEDDRINKK
jgi:hypothetical protein